MDGKDENVDKLNALKEDIRKQLPEWSKKRGHIVSLLDYHLEQLNAIDPVLFLYMTEAQRKQKKEQLMLTLHLLSIKASLDIAENRTKTIKKLNEKMDQCSLYLNQLTILLDHTKQNTDPALDFALLSSDKYLKYLGLEIGAEVAKNIWQFVNLQGENASASNISTWIREQMTEVNNKRLYWVWGGGLVTSTLRLLLSEQVLAPENIEQALHALGHVSPITGYMSWVLYYARFGLSLSLLLKHTIAGPWMSKEEQAIPMSERLKTQLDQRIFSMLNDSIWATANLSCFFWLTGSGGDGVTIALLIMDLVLVSIAFRIEANKHNAEMLALEGHRKKLEDELEDDRHAINKKHKELVWLDEKFSALAKQQDEIEQQKKEANEALLAQLEAEKQKLHNEQTSIDNEQNKLKSELQKLDLNKELTQERLEQLKKTIQQAELDWRFKKYASINSIAYSAGLVLGFILVSSAALASTAPVALALGVAGAAVCFTLNILYSIISGSLDIAKSKALLKESLFECKDLLNHFGKETNPIIKQQLYLEMKSLMAKSEHQKAMIDYQRMQLVHSIFFGAITPAVVFTSLVFMPLGIGLPVLAAFFIIGLLSSAILNHFKPNPVAIKPLEEFKQEAFEEEFSRFELKYRHQFPYGSMSVQEQALTNEDVEQLFEKSSEAKHSTQLGLFKKGKEEPSTQNNFNQVSLHNV